MITRFSKRAATWHTMPEDAPDLSGVQRLNGMFSGAHNFNGNISNWDVSNAVSMNCMFLGARSFNQSINSWDVSSVQGMSNMFDGAWVFQPASRTLGDLSSVTDMGSMFNGANHFRQNLGSSGTSTIAPTLHLTTIRPSWGL